MDDWSREKSVTLRVPEIPLFDDESLAGIVVYVHTRLEERRSFAFEYEGRRVVVERLSKPERLHEDDWRPMYFRAYDTKHDRSWAAATLRGLLREMIDDHSSFAPFVAKVLQAP